MLLSTQIALADHVATLYGNSAGVDGIRGFTVDVDTGTVSQFLHITQGAGSNQIAPGNGRGVVVVGNTMYYTYSGDGGGVYSYNLGTNTNNGVLFHVAGASGISTAGYDGTDLILSDYTGSNHAFFYTTGGALVSTISLNNAAGFYDGLEYANGMLIANRGDAQPPYDKYNLTGGAPVVTNFINAGVHQANDTGIAFDGTYYFVSEIFAQALGVYDINGNFVKEISLTSLPGVVPGCSPGLCIEDLSADYQVVLGNVPEPGSIALLGTVVGMVALGLRRRRA